MTFQSMRIPKSTWTLGVSSENLQRSKREVSSYRKVVKGLQCLASRRFRLARLSIASCKRMLKGQCCCNTAWSCNTSVLWPILRSGARDSREEEGAPRQEGSGTAWLAPLKTDSCIHWAHTKLQHALVWNPQQQNNAVGIAPLNQRSV